MRLLWLFLRSRSVPPAIGGLGSLAGLCWVAGMKWGRFNDLGLLASVVCPLAAAVIVGTTVASPFSEMERTISRYLKDLRFTQIAGQTTIATAVMVGAGSAWQGDGLRWQFARNTLGLTGLALLSALILGSRWPWIVPVAFSMVALAQFATTRGEPPRWAWVVLPMSGWTTAVALGLSVAGLSLVSAIGVRERNAAA